MIPLELRNKPQWVGWNLIESRKIPLNCKTGEAASTTNPSTWTTYADAIRAAAHNSWRGVGFVFNGADLVGIDLDHCINGGVISDLAKNILERTRSYTEISQSGYGIHILVKGVIPKALKTAKKDAGGNLYDQLEIYNSGRYFAMTGNQVPNTPNTIRPVDLSWLYPQQDGKPVYKSITERLKGLAEGNRNETFTSLAGTLRNRGLEANDLMEILRPHAVSAGTSLDELAGICERMGNKPTHTNDTHILAGDVDTATFLAEEESHTWLIDNYLTLGSIAFFAGLSQSQKTWAMMDLAIEAARGGLWLGKLPVKPCKVWYVEQERGKIETRRRFNALLKAKDIKVPANLIIRPCSTFRVNDDRSFENLDRRLQEQKFDLVIIDPFKKFHSMNELSSSDMIFVMERLHQLRLKHNCTFMMIHHEPKGVIQKRLDNQEISMFDAAGTADLQNAAEHFFNVVVDNKRVSWIHQTKNTPGLLHPPIPYVLEDLLPDRSSIQVRAI